MKGIGYTQCVEVWTPEDVEAGERNDRADDLAEFADTFREMVKMLRFTERSGNGMPRDWYTAETTDDRTGDRTITTYHPKTARDARYMLKAWRMSHPATK